MKRFYLIFLFTLSIFFLVLSCTSQVEERNPEFIEFLKLEIPDELADNNEVIDFFKSSEKDINQFSDNIETLFFQNQELLLKKTEDLDNTGK